PGSLTPEVPARHPALAPRADGQHHPVHDGPTGTDRRVDADLHVHHVSRLQRGDGNTREGELLHPPDAAAQVSLSGLLGLPVRGDGRNLQERRHLPERPLIRVPQTGGGEGVRAPACAPPRLPSRGAVAVAALPPLVHTIPRRGPRSPT